MACWRPMPPLTGSLSCIRVFVMHCYHYWHGWLLLPMVYNPQNSQRTQPPKPSPALQNPPKPSSTLPKPLQPYTALTNPAQSFPILPNLPTLPFPPQPSLAPPIPCMSTNMCGFPFYFCASTSSYMLWSKCTPHSAVSSLLCMRACVHTHRRLWVRGCIATFVQHALFPLSCVAWADSEPHACTTSTSLVAPSLLHFLLASKSHPMLKHFEG